MLDYEDKNNNSEINEVKELLNGVIAVESSLEFDLVKRLSDDISSIRTSNVFVDKRKTKTNMSSKIWGRIFWAGRNKKDKNKRIMYKTFWS